MENMKYVRTKDSIYEYEKVKTRVFIQQGRYSKEKLLSEEESLKLFPYEIIKQADTIEELCDGLIVEDKDNTNNWFVMDISEYQSKDNVDKKYMVDRWNFYAFIKTDKGLIYVAKMNESGVLELI